MENSAMELEKKRLFLPNGMFTESEKPINMRKGTMPLMVEKLNLPWEEALQYGKHMSFKQGEMVSATENSGRYFYYLKKGSIQTWYEGELGIPLLHMFMREGTLFNEMICFSNIHKNDFIVFMKASEAVRFDKLTLFTSEFCKTYPHLLLNAACSIARKGLLLSEFRNAFAHMETINHVASILFTIAESNENIEITQEHMAKILRVHRSSITRVIKQLKDMGIISKSTKKQLIIADMEKLRQLAFGETL